MTALLYALAVPNEGCEAGFPDTEAAYAALPNATKQRIAGLRVRHHWEFAYDGKPGFREASDNKKRANPAAVHPRRPRAPGKRPEGALPLVLCS